MVVKRVPADWTEEGQCSIGWCSGAKLASHNMVGSAALHRFEGGNKLPGCRIPHRAAKLHDGQHQCCEQQSGHIATGSSCEPNDEAKESPFPGHDVLDVAMEI